MVAPNPRISMPPIWAAELLGGLSIRAAAPAPASGAPAGAAASGVAAVQLGGTDRPPIPVAWPMAADGISRAGASLCGVVISGWAGMKRSIPGIAAGAKAPDARMAVAKPALDAVVPPTPEVAPAPWPKGMPSKSAKLLIADGKLLASDEADELSVDGSPIAA